MDLIIIDTTFGFIAEMGALMFNDTYVKSVIITNLLYFIIRITLQI